MKQKLALPRLGILIALVLFCFSFIHFTPSNTATAAAGINHQINFQGKLVNTDGTNVTDGSYSIVFSLYSVSSAGSAIWTETQSTTVSNGIFQVNLGSVTTLPGSIDFNTDNIYLGIKVGADAEMTPRIQFTSVPQAFNSEKLGGLDKTGFIQNTTVQQAASNFNISGAGVIGTTLTTPTLQSAAATALTITGNAASTWSTSAGNITLQAGGGTVSLGSTTTLSSTGALTITGGTTLALTSTSTNAISLDSGTTGAVNIGTGTGATKTIQIGNTGTSGLAETINIGNATGTSTAGIIIGSVIGTSSTTLNGGTGVGAITLTPGTAGTIVIGAAAGTGNITLGSSTAAQTVVIGGGTGVSTVQIANDPTSGNTVTIAGGATATTKTDIVNIATGNTVLTGAKTVHIADGTPGGSGANLVTIGSAANASAVTLNAGTGNINLQAGTIVGNATTQNLFNTVATTLNFGGAAATFNIGPGAAAAASINLAGGSGATGCTVDGATGNLNCSGSITSGSGGVGFLTRSGINLQPTTAGDNFTTTGDISTTSTGSIRSNGVLNANFGGKTALTIADSGAQNSGITFGADTNLYRTNVNALQTDDSLIVGINLSVTGTSTLTGNMAIGASVDANKSLVVVNSPTDPAAIKYGTDSRVLSTQTAANAIALYGVNGQVDITGTGGNTGPIAGVNGLVTYSNTGVATNIQGGLFLVNQQSGGGGISNARGFYGRVDNNSTNAITNAFGFQIANNLGTGSITNNTGLWVGALTGTGAVTGVQIDTPTGGAGTAALWLNGTGGTAASGILFGNDTNLYRSAANTLKTDDTFLIQTAIDSATAFQVQNAGGTTLLKADTINSVLTVNKGNLIIAGVGTPATPSVAAGSNQGGTLSGSGATTYFYKVTALNAAGESIPSAEASIAANTFTPITAPTALTAAATGTAGAVICNATGCNYKVTYTTANGETTGGTTSNTVVNVASKTVSLTAIPLGPTGTTSRKVYRSTNGGGFTLCTTLADNVTTIFTDNSTCAGAAIPGANTARTNTNNATVTFTTIAGATSYRIYRGTATNAESAYQTTAASPFTDTGTAGTSASPPTNSSIERVGIGVAAPLANLHVAGDALFRNAVDTTTAFQIQNAGAAALFVADTLNGRIGINRTTPGATLDVNGTIYLGGLGAAQATQLCINGAIGGSQIGTCSSSKAYKHDINALVPQDYDRILNEINQTDIYTYYHNTDHPDFQRTGLIGEYIPAELQVPDSAGNMAPDWFSVYGYLWGGIKAMSTKVSDLQTHGNLDALNTNQATINNAIITGTANIQNLQVSNAVVNSTLAVNGQLTATAAVINGAISAGSLNLSGSAQIVKLVVTGNASFSGNLTIGGHIITAGTAPLIGALTATGENASVTVEGNDTSGTITVNTGDNPTVGMLSTLTFYTPYEAAPRVVLTAIGTTSAGSQYYYDTTTSSFDLGVNAAPLPHTTYKYSYFIAQ